MSTITREFTKEQLVDDIAHAEEKSMSLCGPCADDHARLAYWLRIALASLEAEVVAWIVHARTGDQLTTDGGYVANAEGILGLHSTPLYTAPPAPADINAEPVAWDYEWASCITCEGPQNFKRVIEREAPPEWSIEEGQARDIIPLFNAPPAPVCAPDLEELEAVLEWILKLPAPTFAAVPNAKRVQNAINACRAAMLQGKADGVRECKDALEEK